ncbi:hypothetical protein IR083_20820 [Dysgonomonas sp. GY75]|uniref:hypothetical protein n=1 Tax=Dysgonomonas sp. GY75 TaxID=2780419 RepID=UPI001883CBEE|nr:hypothetical protein [Dysgonomonas sp. GY75]MBF0651265.1 hypothetical protein [Dysgonomonas sp. GY75]
MKCLISILCLILFFSCVSTPEDRAKKLIQNRLHETLNDEKSYESVSYGKLDSVYTSIYEDESYKKSHEDYFTAYAQYIEDSIMYDVSCVNYYGYRSSDCNNLQAKMLESLESMKFYTAINDSVKASFKPELVGYSIRHSYRANNAMGSKTIGHYEFYFDKDITEITDVKDISKSHQEIQ